MRVAISLAVVLFATGCAEAEPPKLPVPPAVRNLVLPPTANNWASAVAESQRRRKYILLFYTATWCGPCKQLHANIAPRERFMRTNFVKAVIDIDQERPLEHLGVGSIPAYFVLDNKGAVVNAGSGLKTQEEFVQWLNSTQYPSLNK